MRKTVEDATILLTGTCFVAAWGLFGAVLEIREGQPPYYALSVLLPILAFIWWRRVVKAEHVREQAHRVAEGQRQAAMAAKREQQSQKEAAARAERRARDDRIRELMQRGEAFQPNSSTMVVCSNRHVYKYCDFVVRETNLEGHLEYDPVHVPYRDSYGDTRYRAEFEPVSWVEETASSYRGCPLCKSTAWEFQDPALKNRKECTSCRLWVGCSHTKCPVCGKWLGG